MNDNQIMVVHSRGVYNFIEGMILASSLFHFSVIMHSFQKIVSDFGKFQHLYIVGDTAKWHTPTFRVRMIFRDNRV